MAPIRRLNTTCMVTANSESVGTGSRETATATTAGGAAPPATRSNTTATDPIRAHVRREVAACRRVAAHAHTWHRNALGR